MAHRALTLKYRPQTFGDMIGQEHVSNVLAAALESGRVAHAYLFTGARGVGKTTSARILAKALDCETPAGERANGVEPCNRCSSCVAIMQGTSLDVSEIDGASNRGIADVQALRERVRFAPTGGRYRVVIIDEVHQLSGDAFAALLKTLEEPPPHLVFIFATTDPQKLPDTIRSRTQRFDFARVPLRKVADRLLDIAAREAKDPDGVDFTLTEGAALLIAHKSEGSMRDAVSALDQVVSAGEANVDEPLARRVLGIADRETFFTLLSAILGRDPKAALVALHQAFDKGVDARDLAEGLAEHVRHVLVLKLDPEARDLVALAREDVARLQADGAPWSEHDLLRLLKLASESIAPMRDSAQPLLHLEAAVLQMATLEPGETLAMLLQRLESLEQRLGGAAPGPAARGAAGGVRAQATPYAPPAPTSPRIAPPAPEPGRGIAPRAMTPSPAPPVPVVPAPRPAAQPPTAATRGAPVLAGAAAPARAAAATAVADEEPNCDDASVARWRDVVGAVNGRKRMLGAFLEETRFVGVTRASIVLAMDDLRRAVVDEKDNRLILNEEASRAFGRALELRCTAVGAGELPKPVRGEDVRPMVEQALEWFQGEAIERGERARRPSVRKDG